MKFDKGRRQIVVFLVVYLLISAMVFLTSFPYLSFKTLSETAELRLYSLFSIVAASFVFFYTKRMFKHASSFEKTVVTQNDAERREEERKEQERINAENRKRKAEAEKKELTEKVAEISSGLDGESPEKYFDQLLINMSKCLDIVQGVAYALRSTDSKYFMAGSYAYDTASACPNVNHLRESQTLTANLRGILTRQIFACMTVPANLVAFVKVYQRVRPCS